MRRLSSTVLLLLPCLSLTSPVIAALIVVPDQVPTIQAAIIAAASGDSVLVRAGTYAESLTLTDKDLTIFGEFGAQATAITGSSMFRILEAGGPNVTTATVIEDLTFRNGRATQGAGIRLSSGASLTLRRCRFLQNAARGTDGNVVAGGAVLVGTGSTLLADSCLFQDNSAAYIDASTDASGGAIEGSPGSWIEVRQSDFIHNSTSGFEGGLGGGINAYGRALVEDCRFREGFASEGAGIRAGTSFVDEREARKRSGMTDGELIVRRCVFQQNTVILPGAAGIHCERAAMTLENNTFFSNLGPALVVLDSKGTITHNTMTLNGIAIKLEILNPGPLLVSNNIVSNNFNVGVSVSGGPAPGSLACNDVWGNEGGNYSGIPDPTGTNGNISANPLFCNAPARDFTLAVHSPCAPEHSPAGCGLIGALPVGCAVADIADSPTIADQRLRVLTNPVRGVAKFEAGSGVTFRQLSIFDSQGRLVEQVSGEDGHWEWTPGTAPAGIYFAVPEGKPVGAESVKFLYLR